MQYSHNDGPIFFSFSILGICPQQNILLDNLTSFEHLKFFAGIKGIPQQRVESEVCVGKRYASFDNIRYLVNDLLHKLVIPTHLRGCLFGRRDGTFPGTGSRHACIYLLFVPFRLYGNDFAWMFFVLSRQSGIPIRSTGFPGKAGQFLSYKHSAPPCRDDIMLSLQIVPGEIVPGRNILM